MISPPPFSWEVASFPTHTNTWNPVSSTNTAPVMHHKAIAEVVFILTIGWIQISHADVATGNLFERQLVILLLMDPMHKPQS